MVDETAGELFSQHDDDAIGQVDLLGSGAGSPFTDDAPLDDDAHLGSLFEDQPLPSLDSPLTSPPRSTNSSVESTDTALVRNSRTASLGLPGNELVEEDWRNDALDLRARKEILLEIVKILHARKENPTNKWLRDLPYKARKLEDQLYLGAPSLDDYRDKKTLKRRLKRVARDIKSRYRANMVNRSSPAKQQRSSTDLQSLKSLADEQKQRQQLQQQQSAKAAPSRESISSILASELASLQSLVNEQQALQTPSRRPSMGMSNNITPTDLASLQTSLATPEQYHHHAIQQRRRSSASHVVTPRTSNTSDIASELASLQALNNVSNVHPRMNYHRSSSMNRNNNADLAALMGSSTRDGHIHPSRITPSHGRRNSLPPPNMDRRNSLQSSNNMNHRSSFHRQPESVEDRQATNQKLQDQILENIRQQQQLMRELMMGKSSSSSNTSSRVPSRPSSQQMMLNRAAPKTSLTQSMLLNAAAKHDNSHHHHHRRQLPMNVLQQSLTNASSTTEAIMRRNSNNFHGNTNMAPSRHYNNDLSPNSFNW